MHLDTLHVFFVLHCFIASRASGCGLATVVIRVKVGRVAGENTSLEQLVGWKALLQLLEG